MDLATQSRILEIANRSTVKPLVLLGSPDADSAELSALTVLAGDPTFSGPLAGVPLGLPVYHVLEDEIASIAGADVYEAQVGLMGIALDAEEICSAMQRVRREAGSE
jgi:glycine reductase